jgi:hypothetical protein
MCETGCLLAKIQMKNVKLLDSTETEFAAAKLLLLLLLLFLLMLC